MSLFKKMFASLGIGGAKVDTILEFLQVPAGEEVTGIVEIKGGSTTQTIDAIKLHLVTQVQHEEGRDEFVLESYLVAEQFEMQEGVTEQIPFGFRLPHDTPVSSGHVKVWVKTELEIQNAIDSQDNDYLEVTPAPLLATFLNAMAELGLEVFKSEVVPVHPTMQHRLPFAQEFEFKPVGGQFAGRLDEVEVICFPDEWKSEFLLEIDRRGRGISGWMQEWSDTDETNVRLIFNNQKAGNIHAMAEELAEVLERYS